MNNYVGIPVADLMCVDMPSAHLLREEGALEMSEIPAFFNTVQAAVSVWADFLGRITSSTTFMPVVANRIYNECYAIR